MKLNPNFVNLFSEITNKAAIATSSYIGSRDKNKADAASVKEMRKNLNELNINGRIVIGEGELDEAPMLYIGEKVGKAVGEEIDLAVDPIEGTNFVANNFLSTFPEKSSLSRFLFLIINSSTFFDGIIFILFQFLQLFFPLTQLLLK